VAHRGFGRGLAERVYFATCLALGRLLRSSRYSKVRFLALNGEPHVLKSRRFYAPLLIRMGTPLLEILDTGVRILPQREWEERERRLYHDLYGREIGNDEDGTLVLPRFEGSTLARLLEDPALDSTRRHGAITHVVVALVALHRRGWTHADAMAENVLIDLDARVARFVDFETIHDSSRSPIWRRADDLRALLTTCVLRTAPEHHAAILKLILDTYADEEVVRSLVTTFSSVLQRPLMFHLGQAPLSYQDFLTIARLLRGAHTSDG
jgi:serine/threonine protein kinase